MGKQEHGFLNGEGDAWLQRNIGKIGGHSVVLDALKQVIPPPHGGLLLEIGASNGWQLAQIADIYYFSCYGIDPSDEACADAAAKFSNCEVERGVASDLHNFRSHTMDVIIYGFCLYLNDRETLAKVVQEGDRVLAEQGYLVIHDFDPEYPHRVEYHHRPGFYSYKMDYSALFLANPAYHLALKTKPDAETAVWILQKDTAAGWAKAPPTRAV